MENISTYAYVSQAKRILNFREEIDWNREHLQLNGRYFKYNSYLQNTGRGATPVLPTTIKTYFLRLTSFVFSGHENKFPPLSRVLLDVQ